jgi:hypothetical protein
MKYFVEFIGHDGKTRYTQPMSKLAAELAQLMIPFESKIIEIGVN